MGMLVLVVRTLGLVGVGTLGAAEKLAVYVATGLYLGHVGNANAHELINRGSRGLHSLGVGTQLGLRKACQPEIPTRHSACLPRMPPRACRVPCP